REGDPSVEDDPSTEDNSFAEDNFLSPARKRFQKDFVSGPNIMQYRYRLEPMVSCRGIIIESKAGGLKKTSEVHPAYDSLHYILLHPRGEDWTYKKYKKWPRPGQTSAGPHGDSYDGGNDDGQLEMDVDGGNDRARKSREYAKLKEFY
ncbi:hypothetical protein BX616_009456, partial [Lobosporangium transversale]